MRQKFGTPTRKSSRLEIKNRNKADRNNPFHVDFVEREYTTPKKRRFNEAEKAYNKAKTEHDDYFRKKCPGLHFHFETDDEEDYTTME